MGSTHVARLAPLVAAQLHVPCAFSARAFTPAPRYHEGFPSLLPLTAFVPEWTKSLAFCRRPLHTPDRAGFPIPTRSARCHLRVLGRQALLLRHIRQGLLDVRPPHDAPTAARGCTRSLAWPCGRCFQYTGLAMWQVFSTHSTFTRRSALVWANARSDAAAFTSHPNASGDAPLPAAPPAPLPPRPRGSARRGGLVRGKGEPRSGGGRPPRRRAAVAP